MVGWIGIALAVLAVLIAWRANRLSKDSNELATRALSISEADYAERERARRARARLSVAVSVALRDPDDGGVLRLGGSHGNLQLAIAITNDGDRDAGRGKVEFAFPASMSEASVHWSDPSGRALPDYPERAACIGDVNVLSRTIEGVGRRLGETLFVRVPVDIPRDGVNEYPLAVRVAADGADAEATLDYPLRIGRASNG